jgi:hypothetical protein
MQQLRERLLRMGPGRRSQDIDGVTLDLNPGFTGVAGQECARLDIARSSVRLNSHFVFFVTRFR